MGNFLLQYLNQFGSFLYFILATFQAYWALYCVLLEEQIHIILFMDSSIMHDAFQYIERETAQMKNFKSSYLVIQNALQTDGFAVSKSNCGLRNYLQNKSWNKKIKRQEQR